MNSPHMRSGSISRSTKIRLFYFSVVIFAIIVISAAALFVANTDGGVDTGHKFMSECVDKYQDKNTTDKGRVPALWEVMRFCYNYTGLRLVVDQDGIKRDNYIFQRHETLMLLFVVVAITLSGVALAGLQLLGSYRLAAIGRAHWGDETEIAASSHSVSLRSSIVGLAILFISFAFFIVFVKDVYVLRDPVRANISGESPSMVTEKGSLIPNQPVPPASSSLFLPGGQDFKVQGEPPHSSQTEKPKPSDISPPPVHSGPKPQAQTTQSSPTKP